MGFLDRIQKKKQSALQNTTTPQPYINVPPSAPSKDVAATMKRQRGVVSAYELQLNKDAIANLEKRFIAFDVETTGLSPQGDRIVEVGAVLFESGEAIRCFGTLVNPKMMIPYAASAVNQITNDMLVAAPPEEEIYSNLVHFLGDSLDAQTVICAHNARFDMNFLSETLMRLGYSAEIKYVDTLSLSRKLIKGLTNYKQETIVSYFGVRCGQAHRAVADAEACGRVLCNLIKIEIEQESQRRQQIEESKPSEEEMEVCAFIQDCIVRNGGDIEWLGFAKQSGNYVDVSYLFSLIKFKISKKGKYIIVKKSFSENLRLNTQPCTMSEGGTDFLRVYFDSPFELEPLASCFFAMYKSNRKSAMDYFNYYPRQMEDARNSRAMMNQISSDEVEKLLLAADKRRAEEATSSGLVFEAKKSKPRIVRREDITINPLNDRVPLSKIRNIDNWSKGFDEGFRFWEQGDDLRKSGKFDEAMRLFDQARYNGYCSRALFESYAMVYRKLEDYDNEIQILEEGIERTRTQEANASLLEARRDKAVFVSKET